MAPLPLVLRTVCRIGNEVNIHWHCATNAPSLSEYLWRKKMANDASSGARWRAVVSYRTDAGKMDVEMFLEEIADLQDRIEHGPHWDTVYNIAVERINHIQSPSLTVEQASKL